MLYPSSLFSDGDFYGRVYIRVNNEAKEKRQKNSLSIVQKKADNQGSVFKGCQSVPLPRRGRLNTAPNSMFIICNINATPEGERRNTRNS
jgi:hypothetical protein